LGATETVAWSHFPSIENCLNQLKADGYFLYAIEQTHGSIALHQIHFEPDKKYAFIMGNEVSGVSDEALQLVDGVIEIPQFGTKHSLNVSVSAGIIAWHFVNQKLSQK
jgi:tRNA G18 (ribose-2'-O)-methylase SpoU